MSKRQELTEAFFDLQEKKEKLKNELSLVQLKMDRMEQELIDCMQNEDLESFKDSNYGTVYMRNSCRAQLLDHDVAFQWLRDNGYGDIIKETVNSNTLSAIVKDLPEEIAGIARFDSIKICRRKS
jgi:hypothetical protein